MPVRYKIVELELTAEERELLAAFRDKYNYPSVSVAAEDIIRLLLDEYAQLKHEDSE